MIQANELRIGNWVNLYGVPHQLMFVGYNTDGYDGYSAHFKGRSSTLEDHFKDGEIGVEGIPLTKEWLLKFGFEYIEIGEEVHEQKWCIGGNEFIWGPTSENNFYHDFLNGGEVKYVHQLQNLYKALTNEELTINQP